MDKEQTAIKRLQEASEMSLRLYHLPLVVTTSGGKDSSVCVALAQAAGIPFEALHSHTTVDAPETVRFVRAEFKRLEQSGTRCEIKYPRYGGKPVSMWSLIPLKRLPPTRIMRYCCEVMKEHSGEGRFIATGVRWDESTSRKKRAAYEVQARNEKDRIRLNDSSPDADEITLSGEPLMLRNDNSEKRMELESCNIKAQRICNPIIDWTDRDVWDYLHDSKVPVNPLYGEGFCRIGCIGCPMAGKHRKEEFVRYPRFKANYIRAFDRMLEKRKEERLKPMDFESGEDVFHWWMEDGEITGQISLEELEELED